MPGLEVGDIDDEAFGVLTGGEPGLAGDRLDMLRIGGFPESHIIVSPHGIAVRLEIDVVLDVKVHAASHVLHHEAVAAGHRALEVNVPYIGARKILPSGLQRAVRGGFPELNLAGLHGGFRVHIVQPDLLSFIGLVIPRSAVAEPQVQVRRLALLPGRIAQDVHMDSLREGIPDIELDRSGRRVGAAIRGNLHGIGTSLAHRFRERKEDPVLAFAGEGVVRVHRLGLPGRSNLDGPESGVVRGGDGPAGGFRVQTREEHQQRVIAFDEGMSQIGALSGAVVPVADVTVLETDHEGFLVDHLDALVLGGAGRQLEEGGECDNSNFRHQRSFHKSVF